MRPMADPGRIVLAAAAGATGLVLLGFVLWTAEMVRAWLVADLFFLGLSLGALVLLMVQGIVGGAWSQTIRPTLVLIASALPAPALGMLVPLLGMPAVFGWIEADVGTLPERVANKLIYLDPLFLAGRTFVTLTIWIGLAALLGVWSGAAPRGRDAPRCVTGLILFAITITFFSTDWMMALEPTFASTIYAMLEASGEIAGAFALGIVMLFATGVLHERQESAPGVLVAEDLANLLFGFTLLWVYLAFMQWLIVWSGDLPDEIGWYLRRSQGLWLVALLLLVLCHFLLPVAGFLSRRLKRSPAGLATLAGIILTGHLIDVMWRMAPALAGSVAMAPLVVLALLAIGGLWAGAILRLAPLRRPQTPTEPADA